MNKDAEIEKLRKEIRTLRDTVSDLTRTIDDLKTTVSSEKTEEGNDTYKIFTNSENCLDYDASWLRLMGMLERTDDGLSAAEAAKKWGKSRSRTSEVLNKLADEGHLVKYRDGREIKFRAVDE
ncbi:MAG: MarR family transcriptional regulator [Candidatus Thorarchaeota archaeon]